MSNALINFGEMYHTGIVVDEVEVAKAEFSALMGVTWGVQGETDMPIWTPSGPRIVNFKYAYTNEGPHRLELVGRIPGTLWEVTGAGHAHHFGYWCDDVESTSAEMVNRGMPLVAKVGVDNAEADAMIVLHQMKTGAYIELVSSLAREQMFGGK